MKIRTDFVTNSSSASFMVELSFYLQDGRILKFADSCEYPDEEGAFSSLMIETEPRQLGSASNIEEMITLLKKSVSVAELSDVEYEVHGDLYVFDEEDVYAKKLMEREEKTADYMLEGNKEYLKRNYEFIEQLRNLKDMSEIEKIILSAEAADYDEYEKEYIEYDLKNKAYVRKTYDGAASSAGGIELEENPNILDMQEEKKNCHLKLKFTNPLIFSIMEKRHYKSSHPSYSKRKDVVSIEIDTECTGFDTEKKALEMIFRVLREIETEQRIPNKSIYSSISSELAANIDKIRWKTIYLEMEAVMCVDEEKGIYKKLTADTNERRLNFENGVYKYREEIYQM